MGLRSVSGKRRCGLGRTAFPRAVPEIGRKKPTFGRAAESLVSSCSERCPESSGTDGFGRLAKIPDDFSGYRKSDVVVHSARLQRSAERSLKFLQQKQHLCLLTFFALLTSQVLPEVVQLLEQNAKLFLEHQENQARCSLTILLDAAE